METPIETLTPAFVPPTDPVPEDDYKHTRFHDFGIQEGLSIEAVELKFTQSRRRSVYGTIYINAEFNYVHTLYNRRTEEAETMSSPSGGHLTLCGPKYLLCSRDSTLLYVDLYEVDLDEGGKGMPFFQARVPLQSDITKPFSVESPRKEATLTIQLTPISPCILTKISVKLSHPQLVSGSVVAIQNLRIPPDGTKEVRRVCLFKRLEHVPLRADDMIKLDREVFLAPLWFEKSYIEKMHQLDLNADEEDIKKMEQLWLKADEEDSKKMDQSHLVNADSKSNDGSYLAKADSKSNDDSYPNDGILPDGGFYNGNGSYLSVEVDLKLVDEASVDKYCLVRETFHYQFKSSDVHRADFTATCSTAARFPRVSVTLQPFLDVVTRMNGEPDEHDMRLYVKTESEEEWELEPGLDEWRQEFQKRKQELEKKKKGKKPITESEVEECKGKKPITESEEESKGKTPIPESEVEEFKGKKPITESEVEECKGKKPITESEEESKGKKPNPFPSQLPSHRKKRAKTIPPKSKNNSSEMEESKME